MSSHPSRLRGIFLLGTIIVSIAVGVIFLSPEIEGGKFIGGSFGFVLAIFISRIFFPDIRRSSGNIWNGKNILGVNMKNYFTHTTQIPMMLGFLWFIIFMALGIFTSSIDKSQNKDNPYLLFVFLSPSFFLIGLSGFLMIKRNEGVNKFGEIYKGFWAYFNGALGIIFGWGLPLLMFLAYVFKW